MPKPTSSLTIPRQPLVGPITGTEYPRARRVGCFTDYEPTAQHRRLIAAVEAVRPRLAAAGVLPLSPRAWGYRVTKLDGWNKSDVATVSEFVTLARRAGWMEWSDVDDSRTRTLVSNTDPTTDGLAADVGAAIDRWRLWRRRGQATAPEVFVEAVGSMRSVLNPCIEFGARLVSSGGFNSVTELGKLSDRAVCRWREDGQTTTVLLVGDHDDAGLGRMDRSAADALALIDRFYLDGAAPDEVLRFVHVALTAEQIIDWDVSPSDSQGRKFELEAVDPVVLRDHLAAELESMTDADVLARTDAESDEYRAEFRREHDLEEEDR